MLLQVNIRLKIVLLQLFGLFKALIELLILICFLWVLEVFEHLHELLWVHIPLDLALSAWNVIFWEYGVPHWWLFQKILQILRQVSVMLLIEFHPYSYLFFNLLIHLLLQKLHFLAYFLVIGLSPLNFHFKLLVRLQEVLVPSGQFFYLLIILYCLSPHSLIPIQFIHKFLILTLGSTYRPFAYTAWSWVRSWQNWHRLPLSSHRTRRTCPH